MKSSFPQLAHNLLHVWRLPIPETVDPDLINLLAPLERARADRYLATQARTTFAYCRSALRVLLGKYLHYPAAEISFALAGNGKPILARPGNALHFNLSHCPNLGIIAVSRDFPLGVDVEHNRELPGLDELMVECMTEPERAALHSLTPHQRTLEFYRNWVTKEAFVKASGIGLSHPLSQLDAVRLPACPLFVPANFSAAVAFTQPMRPIIAYYDLLPEQVMHLSLLPERSACTAANTTSRD